MAKIERLKALEQLIGQRHSVTVDEIVQELNVSEPTARRDINFLLEHSTKYLKIINGIALKNKGHYTEYLFEKKLNQHALQKAKIAKKCGQLLQDGDTILLDSGSTCFFVAQELAQKSLTVVTTDIRVAMELSKYPKITLHTIGGTLRSGHYTLLGQIAIQNLQLFHVPIAIISADSLDPDEGLSNIELLEATSKQQIRKIAETLIVVMDSSKINQKSFYKVLALHDIDMIITDDGITDDAKKKIAQQNIRLEIVS